ncbi:hypothetical protein AMJ80_07665 [bacterium SM23_31]|nr:MAG: hypothetical protein AMJ80_07665 [bacterium SM23_31]
MGWNARLSSGIIIRQQDSVAFGEVDLHDIQEMWLDGLERASIHRKLCPDFIEFVQFEVAQAMQDGPKKIGEFIGWTNGKVEFILGITKEKHNFHPGSRLK